MTPVSLSPALLHRGISSSSADTLLSCGYYKTFIQRAKKWLFQLWDKTWLPGPDRIGPNPSMFFVLVEVRNH